MSGINAYPSQLHHLLELNNVEHLLVTNPEFKKADNIQNYTLIEIIFFSTPPNL
ncbi:MAG: hypothetical protein ACE5R6_16235 [Candidatus Heimdallarchaeota archaeon]